MDLDTLARMSTEEITRHMSRIRWNCRVQGIEIREGWPVIPDNISGRIAARVAQSELNRCAAELEARKFGIS